MYVVNQSYINVADTLRHLDLDNISETTRVVYAAFWSSSIPTLPTNDYLQSIIKDLEADWVAFCAVFSCLLFLASLGALETVTLKENIATPLAEIWNGHIKAQNQSCQMEGVWLTQFTNPPVELDVQTSFVTLYSIHSPGFFKHSTTFALSHIPARTCSLRCMSQLFTQYELSRTEMTKYRHQKTPRNRDEYA